ncbi:Hypothetical_protein [Hexamita inflata]|uniref:Hypothetical_protein n=1 Tax=Hexamita inflata TaxID=28002 RepID=A0AA86NL87_9EUKA|nr:Hypothetical protein HINF_LOCUS8571 [Hexamita inflata]
MYPFTSIIFKKYKNEIYTISLYFKPLNHNQIVNCPKLKIILQTITRPLPRHGLSGVEGIPVLEFRESISDREISERESSWGCLSSGANWINLYLSLNLFNIIDVVTI